MTESASGTEKEPRRVSLRISAAKGIHLALGGGAARGLAHIGVLRALEEAKIPIASICGTSMGALVGALYALNPESSFVQQKIKSFVNGDVYNHARFAFIRAADQVDQKERRMGFRQLLKHGVLWGRAMAFGSMIPFEEFDQQVQALVPAKRFGDTSIRFFVLACDVNARREVVFHEGLIRSAVMASSAIPGMFPTIRASQHVYVDGGWMNMVPVSPLRELGAPFVLGVDVAEGLMPESRSVTGVTGILQAYSAAHRRLQQLQMESASLLWRPPVGELHWAEFRQVDEACEIGYRFARDAMPELRAAWQGECNRSWVSRKARAWVARRCGGKRYHVPFEMRAIWEAGPAE